MDETLTVTTEYSAQAALAKPEWLEAFDLLLIDVNMPNLTGFDFLQALNKQSIQVKVLFVSGNEELPDVEHALLPSAEMVAAIKKVLNGDLFLPHNWDESINWAACNPKLNAKSQPKISVAGLRARQIEVLELMHKGHTNLKIASESAVKSHISILFKALDTKNRTAAIKAGLEQALIE